MLLFANDATPYMLVFGSILVAGIIGVWLAGELLVKLFGWWRQRAISDSIIRSPGWSVIERDVPDLGWVSYVWPSGGVFSSLDIRLCVAVAGHVVM